MCIRDSVESLGVSDNENNDALFKSQYGNTIFATTTAIFFLTLITLFFGSDTLFRERGIHCRCLTILCCPCPKPCISLTDSDFNPLSELTFSSDNIRGANVEDHVSTGMPEISFDQPHTEAYLYTERGASKIDLLSCSSRKEHQSELQVSNNFRSTRKVICEIHPVRSI